MSTYCFTLSIHMSPVLSARATSVVGNCLESPGHTTLTAPNPPVPPYWSLHPPPPPNCPPYGFSSG